MSNALPKFLTVQEVAEWLGVHPMTIYRKAAKGQIPAIKIGKSWLFTESALNEWIQSQMKVGGGKKRAEKERASPSSLLLKNGDRFAALPGVELVYLFGSQAAGETTPLSDIDIAYLDDRTSSPFDLEAKIEASVFEIVPDAARIDLVRLNEAPVAVQYKVIRDGSIIYARSEKRVADFEERVVSEYLDYAEVLGRFYADSYKNLKEAS